MPERTILVTRDPARLSAAIRACECLVKALSHVEAARIILDSESSLEDLARSVGGLDVSKVRGIAVDLALVVSEERAKPEV